MGQGYLPLGSVYVVCGVSTKILHVNYGSSIFLEIKASIKFLWSFMGIHLQHDFSTQIIFQFLILEAVILFWIILEIEKQCLRIGKPTLTGGAFCRNEDTAFRSQKLS